MKCSEKIPTLAYINMSADMSVSRNKIATKEPTYPIFIYCLLSFQNFVIKVMIYSLGKHALIQLRDQISSTESLPRYVISPNILFI